MFSVALAFSAYQPDMFAHHTLTSRAHDTQRHRGTEGLRICLDFFKGHNPRNAEALRRGALRRVVHAHSF